MKIHRMHCFGRTDESGNTAVVIEGSTQPEAERLQFAEQQDANSTVFVDTNAAGDPQLDYYYPHARSPFVCMRRSRPARYSSSDIPIPGTFGSSRACIDRLLKLSALTRVFSLA